MDHLQDMLSRLNGSSEQNGNSENNPEGQLTASAAPQYQHPSVSSPIYTPSPPGKQPLHSSAVLSPNPSARNTPADSSSSNQYRGAPDLLGLLKNRQNLSSSNLSQPPVTAHSEGNNSQNRASDSPTEFLASWGRKPSQIGSVQSPSLVAPSQSRPELRGEASASSASPQDFLLKLLNQQAKIDSPRANTATFPPSDSTLTQKPERETPIAQSQPLPNAPVVTGSTLTEPLDLLKQLQSVSVKAESSSPAAPAATQPSPARVFGQTSEDSAAFDLPPPKANVFTYVNPFEQLSASSPLNRTPKPGSGTETPKAVDVLKHNRESSKDTSSPRPAAKARKISQSNSPSNLPSSLPAPAPEALSDAVGEEGERVEKQVEEALAQLNVASETSPSNKDDVGSSDVTVTAKVKRVALTATMSESVNDSGSVVHADWEQAADAGEVKFVKVFSLPMKPFVSIDIQKDKTEPVDIPESKLVHVARMKKEFDQIDRNLVACTPKFIAYALKNGGFRLIRQDSGKYKQLYAGTEERIFGLAIGVTQKGVGLRESETILGTGVKGTVFWSPLAYFGTERDATTVTDDERGFIFPPVPMTDENTSGGQLKTRVKASSRSPEFFGYGRGKSIHIIFPVAARSAAFTNLETKVCDSKQYLNHDNLKISTGKAAKDFAFSADDTVIASLDKSGNMKFWDIRTLIKTEYNSEFRDSVSVELKLPIMTLNTSVPGEKSWPTSLMFVDKEKPMTKGLALRYMIVGMKQNHTVQLWDLGLGKPVQEVNFPHDDESDAICSLAFHPRTGILAVGHPTRNSIYLLNVSPPKYQLPPMGQHKFLKMVAAKDPSVNNPNSTVIVSSVREYSLQDRGQLRSLDLMHEPPHASEHEGGTPYDQNDQLMTLIVMHSKGIFEFRLGREHLGWSGDGKTLNSVDALAAKAIVVRPLVSPVEDSNSANGETVPASAAGKKDTTYRATDSTSDNMSTPKVAKPDVAKSAPPVLSEKDGKKKKKGGDIVPAPASPVVVKNAKSTTSSSGAVPPSPSQRRPTESSARSVEFAEPKSDGAGMTGGALKRMEAAICTEFARAFNEHLGTLYKRLADDKRAADVLGATKQDAILRLVSTTLSENVESTLGNIVTEVLGKTMEPVKDVMTTTVDRTITTAFANSMKSAIPREVEKLLPSMVSKIVQDPSISRTLANGVTKEVANALNSAIPNAFAAIAPTITAVALQSAKQLAADIEQRLAEQMHIFELRHQRDADHIMDLTAQVTHLASLVQSMAEQQMKYQDEIRSMVLGQNFHAQPGHSRDHSGVSHHASNSKGPANEQRETPQPAISEIDNEIAVIQELLAQGKFDEASIKWLHSNNQGELFDRVFVHLNPNMLQGVTPLVCLSVTAAVSYSLDTHLKERLNWLEVALSLVDPVNPEYKVMFPRIMDVLSGRLQLAFSEIREMQPQNTIVNRIANVAHRIQDMRSHAEQSSD